MASLVTNNAESTLLNPVSAGATSLVLSVGDGSLFPVITNKKIDFFFVKLGDDTANEVVKCTARTSDTLNCSAVAHTGGWPSGTKVTLTACKELIDTFQHIINDDLTITVAETGATDYTYLDDALAALKDVRIANGKTVTINVTGHHAPLISDVGIPCADQIKIVGVTYTTAINSVQTSSGSAGSRSYVLNMTSVSNIAVGDFIVCSTVSGGTNPDCLLGAHEVTNVDTGNSRITVFSSHLAAYAAGGAVTSNITIMKTVFDCSGYHGMRVQSTGFQLNKVALKGDGTHCGIYAAMPSSRVNSLEEVVFSGFKCGISLGSGAVLHSEFLVAISRCDKGIFLKSSSLASMSYVIISGCDIGIEADQSTFSAVTDDPNGAGYMNSTSPHIYGCNIGIYAEHGCRIRAAGDIKDSATTGIQAYTHSYIDAVNATFSGNATDCSPAVNTQGNEYAYIDA